VSKLAASLARYHHENWDGTGYPEGLSKENIPIEARIMAIADVFDAIGSNRCYKQAWNDEQIKSYLIEQKNKKFEAELVDIIVNDFESFTDIRVKYPDNY
jgi:response regulator RpfG family c-di-GMP phosphodiesterase